MKRVVRPVMRVGYAVAAVLALLAGGWLRFVADGPAPWWLLGVAGVVALLGFADALLCVLSRPKHRADVDVAVGLYDRLGRPPRGWAVTAGVLFALGWVLLVASLVTLRGSPESDPFGACPYYLNDHGEHTCITQAAYESAVAHSQAAIFGLSAFFLGVAVAATGGGMATPGGRAGPAHGAVAPPAAGS